MLAMIICTSAIHGSESKATKQLAKPVSLTWQEVPLSAALARLAETQSLAIWCDRRIDPNVPITLTVVDQPLVDVFAALGQQADAAATPFGGIVYFAPRQAVDELATLAALARQPLADAPAAARAKWLKPQAWNFHRLSEPRQLLKELAASADSQVQGEQLVPYDLWPARELPQLAAIDRAVLLLAGFNLTCRISPDGDQLEVKPITRPVAIAQEYRVPSSRSAAFNVVLAELNAATTTGAKSRPTITARVEDHDRLKAALSGRPANALPAAVAMRTAGEKRAGRTLEDRRFTLTIENKPLAPVLSQLAAQLELQLEWDAALPDTAAGRRVLVSCQVVEADLDELLEALLKPAGLTFDRLESRVSIRKQ